MHSTARKRTLSLDTNPDTKDGLVDQNTITTPPKKRSKTTIKKEVVNDEQVTLPVTSNQEDDNICMPYTPVRATKSLPASHPDDEYQVPASPSPSPKPVKTVRKPAARKPKSPKVKKAAAPKPPKISAAERKALWVDWCNQHVWRRDTSYKPKDGEEWDVMHGVDAAKYFNFRPNIELRVVPYYKFLNEKDVKHPGRARRYSDLLRLAYRKAAYFKGRHSDALEEPGAATEPLMLSDGARLFSACIQRLRDRYRKMQDSKIQDGRLKPYEKKERPGPNVYNTRYLPPPMDDEDGDDSDEELEDEDEYDSDL